MTETPPERPAGSPVGPLVQEAAMLLDVVADRLEAMKKEPAPRQAAAGPAAPPPAGADANADAGDDDEGEAPEAGQAPATGDPATDAGDAGTESVAPSGSDSRCPECGSVPGAYCTACPVCRFMALLRGERPEATARLVDGALMIVRTLRSMVPEPGEPAVAAHQHSHGHHASEQPAQPGRGAAHPHTTPPARRTGLEHINIL